MSLSSGKSLCGPEDPSLFFFYKQVNYTSLKKNKAVFAFLNVSYMVLESYL